VLLPHDAPRTSAKMSIPVEVDAGKRVQPSVNAANVGGLGTRRIFIRDRQTNIKYLIDTGADTCVYPRNKVRGLANKSEYELFAGNKTRITTYGTITLSLNLSLRRDFRCRFVIAVVHTPIIGVDFLSHYGSTRETEDSWTRRHNWSHKDSPPSPR
jgi:hypothetical protein